MKKITIFLLNTLMILFLLTGCSDNIKDDIHISNNVTNETSSIKEKGELHTRGLFSYNGSASYENSLLDNDMTWVNESRLYYKFIVDMDNYNKYKERIDIPDLTEDDFNDKALLIVSNENVRDRNEIDLEISDVIVVEDTTIVKIKQKENPNYNSETNVFYAVVNNSLLRDDVNVVIEHDN